MAQKGRHPRILIYSHDTFGLGHLRRCRAIAHAVTDRHENLSVLILSGSPIIGSFDFNPRVDFVRIPGVIKLSDGAYTPLKLRMDIDETLALRSQIIMHTAKAFDPDLFIVDKEPFGLRGEVRETLEILRERQTPLVLGLRDVLDEAGQLEDEWRRKGVEPALRDYYDEIWVYGLPQICEPLEGLDLPGSVLKKVSYTGYLRREANDAVDSTSREILDDDEPFFLVTAGGGGDGEALFDWVLQAYECDNALPIPAVLVLGPFLSTEWRNAFVERSSRLRNVKLIHFDTHLEALYKRAAGVVAMGGYNTFCEILSFDQRALIVPRTTPRLEQYIRAARARELGLVSMLLDDGERDPAAMATAIRQLPQQRMPSEVVIPGLLDGFDNLSRLVARNLGRTGRFEDMETRLVGTSS